MDGNRRTKRDLKAYYGLENGENAASSTNGGEHSASSVTLQPGNPCNLDGPNFQPQTYLSKLITVSCCAVWLLFVFFPIQNDQSL